MDLARRSSVPVAGALVAGRYRIGPVLGEGGMGVVLSAHDEKTGADVALKLLQAVSESNAERFLREARLASKIPSEHVVRVLDLGALDGRPFLVMELLEGEDFGARVRRGPLPLADVADCIVQTCEALAHAHAAGIIHRDIKASNLFEHRRRDGTTLVKVLDFGISKIIAMGPNASERTLTRTRDGGFLGSPPYMSPEHVRDPRNVDARADLWSLGVVAYRLLSTRFPFSGESTGEVLAAILERRPSRLQDLGVDVPEEVERIIGRCLARAREDRYPDAAALAAAFAPFASPAWRSYHERVFDVVRQAGGRATATGAERRAVVDDEPRTRTVPPPRAPTALAPPSIELRLAGTSSAPAEHPVPSSSRAVVILAGLLVIAVAMIAWLSMRPAPASAREPAALVASPSAPPEASTILAEVDPLASTSSVPSSAASASPGTKVRAVSTARAAAPASRASSSASAPGSTSAPIPREPVSPSKPELQPNPYGDL